MKEGTFVWGVVKLLSDDRNLGYSYGIYHRKGISLIGFKRNSTLLNNKAKIFPINFLREELYYTVDIDPAYISLSNDKNLTSNPVNQFPTLNENPIKFVEGLSFEDGNPRTRTISNRYRFVIYSYQC